MSEHHKGTSFAHSCVKVPVDPCSRQPTPLYERPSCCGATREPPLDRKAAAAGCCVAKMSTTPLLPRRGQSACSGGRSGRRSARLDNRLALELECARDDYRSFMEFVASIPDYMDVYHLSDEQFKQKLDYLKRKQRMLLRNLRNCLEHEALIDDAELQSSQLPLKHSDATAAGGCAAARERSNSRKSLSEKMTGGGVDTAGLALKGKRCNFEESRVGSPLLYPSGSFSCLAEDQDFLTYRCKDREKAEKTRQNEEIMSNAASKCWSSGSESKSGGESLESDDPEIGVETKSLPPERSPQRWQPTLPKPFSFTLREDAEKYMTMVEQQTEAEFAAEFGPSKKNPAKKRRIRPIPLTSKLPLYDKLMAEREERSRIVREESALNLLSQVRPFKLECDRRAMRALSRSSPELSSCARRSPGFRAKPVPRNLFSAEVYDRMLEDEYFRNLHKRIRAMELLRSSSLPPSMSRRSRCKSAGGCSRSARSRSSCTRDGADTSAALSRATPSDLSSAVTSALPPQGNNLAAILRAQAARDKLEREIQERLEEKRREQLLRLRKALIGRKPAWRALRSAARHEHERDLDFRASLRRDEAREQAERHRLQMELMLDRVTQIPTLFERYSQSFQSAMQLCPKLYSYPKTGPRHHHHHHHLPACNGSPDPSRQQQQRLTTTTTTTSSSSNGKKKKKKKKSASSTSKRRSSSSVDSYVSISSSRPNSGSITSSSPVTLNSVSRSSSGSVNGSRKSAGSPKSSAAEKKRHDRGPLKVSINETAELIEEQDDEVFSMDSAASHRLREQREKATLREEEEDEREEVTEKE